MGHQRFRKFNTKDMYPDQTIDNDMCMIVKSGRHIFLRGQTGFDLVGAFVGAGDPGRHLQDHHLHHRPGDILRASSLAAPG